MSVALDKIIGFFFWVAGVFLVSMMLIISVGVISRYFFQYSIKWMVEIPEYMLYSIIFFAFAWIQKNNNHITIDIVTSRLSPKNKAVWNIVVLSVCLIVCLVLTWFGILEVWDNYQSNAVFDQAIRLPKAPIIAIMPLSLFVAFLQLSKQIMSNILNWKKLM